MNEAEFARLDFAWLVFAWLVFARLVFTRLDFALGRAGSAGPMPGSTAQRVNRPARSARERVRTAARAAEDPPQAS